MQSDLATIDYILDESNPWEKRYRRAQFFENRELINTYVFDIRNVEIRLVFLRKIVDQKILLRLAFRDRDPIVRKLAIYGLNSSHHEEFMELAKTDPVWFVRMAGLQKLPGRYQEFFAMILIEEEHDRVRKVARDHVRMHELETRIILRLAIEAWDSIVRKAAFRYISDEDMLYELVMNSNDYNLGEQAIERITNQVYLIKIAKKAEYGHIRAYAAMKIKDEHFLANLFLIDNSPFVREICISKITQLNELAKLRLIARTELQTLIINRMRELLDNENS